MTPAKNAIVLTPFDGRDVLSATVAVTNAGDGLSKAMAVQPTELHHGEKVYVVLECEVSKVRFDELKDTQCLQRVHMLKAGLATIVDEKAVRKALDEQAIRIERAAGVERLPLAEGNGTPKRGRKSDEGD